MAARPIALKLEHLESRLNLSTASGLLTPAGAASLRNVVDAAIDNARSRAAVLLGAEVSAPNKSGVSAPGSLKTTCYPDSIALKWNDNSNNETGFSIYRSADNGSTYSAIATVAANSTSYSDFTAQQNIRYLYKVQAFNTATTSSFSSSVAAMLSPAAPANFQATQVTSTSATLTWTDTSTFEKGFHLYRSTDGVHFNYGVNLAAGTTSFANPGLSPGTTYYYKISAWNSYGENYASIISFTTAPGATLASPTTPSGLNFTSVSSNSLKLNWQDNSSTETGFHVYRSADGANYSLLASVAANTGNYVDNTVAGSTTYYYKVSAWNSAGEAMSAAASLTTPSALPAAPGTLAFTNVTTSSLTLNWHDNANNESGFHVYRSTDGSNYSLLGNAGVNATSFVDNTVAASTTYYYKVSSWNAAGETVSAASNLTTPSAIPPAPSAVNFTNVSNTGLTVTWQDNSSNESGFNVYRSTDGVNYSLLGSAAANASSYIDSNLAGATTYYYKVSAWNAAGEAVSSPNTITTLTAVPLAPSAVNFTNIGTNAVTVNWTDNANNEWGFRVFRSTDGINYGIVANVDVNGSSWTDPFVSPGNTYYYYVAAYNGTGAAASAAASVTTAAVIPPPPTGNPVTIATASMTTFSELQITGTSGNDSIYVSQANGVLTITANGATTTMANTFGDIVVHGGAGNDSITIDSSVNIATLLYGDDGNDTLVNRTTGKATIVDIDNFTNTMTGNGVNTAFWANPNDTITATATEIANGGVNRVANFYQTSVGAVPRSLAGQNLADPSDSGAEHRLPNESFWGAGASMNDINQGTIGDCYYLAPMASLANNETTKFMNTGVDLGDGTYAIRFIRSGVTSYVRVDGDLSNSYFAHPGASGNLWGALYEKAYAFFRTGASTYASLNWGNPNATFTDFGFSASSVAPTASDTTLLSTINNAISSGHAVTAATKSAVAAGAPLIASHCYSIIGAYRNASGTLMIQLRNPWGFDGAGNDGNPGDGLVTLDYSTFAANFSMMGYTTT